MNKQQCLGMISVFCSSMSFGAATYTHGTVDLVESFSTKIVVRWSGSNTQNCSENDVVFTEASMGNADALSRAFSVALSSAASSKPIRFQLDGCFDGKQLASVAQLCSKSNCSY